METSDQSRTTRSTPRATLLLVRHTAVAAELKGICYGASDVALSDDGIAAIPTVVEDVLRHRPTRIFHSGLTRAALLADAIGDQAGLTPTPDVRLRELNFGRWELKSWDAIFAEVGHDMVRLVSEPETFAPHGGETVALLADRAMSWLAEVDRSTPTVAVCHGGVISAIRGRLAGLPASDWPGLVPGYGGIVEID